MALIYNLKNQELELYNEIKNKVLQKYPLYHRQVNFNTTKGLVAFVDKLLSKYSSLILNNTAGSVIRKSISNISSIASSENDAFIMSQILYSFISNCEAAMVNGSLKAFNYALEYLSSNSNTGWGIFSTVVGLVSSYIDSDEYNEKYNSILSEALVVASNVKADVLFTILSAVFAYTRKLMMYFYRYFANDKSMANLAYKNSIPVLQNQLESLLNIFIDTFYSFFVEIFSGFNDFASGYYLETLDEAAFNEINVNISSMFSNNLYSLEDSPEKINNTLISDISSIYNSLIVDVTSFESFIDTLDDDGFNYDKNLLPKKLAEVLSLGDR